MKKEWKVWAMTCIAFWWLAPNQIFCQQQDSVKTKQLDEIVVTATKFPKAQGQTGKVLEIIDRQELERSIGKDLSQILSEIAGVYVTGANSNPGKDKAVYIRGAATHHTLILVDGIPLNDPSGANGGIDLRLISLSQVERIEILKGSQSTLYGSDALGGVINIITRTNADVPVTGDVSLSYGTYNSFQGMVGVRGKAGKFTYQGGFGRNSSDGISEAKDTTGMMNFDKDGSGTTSAKIKLGYISGKFQLSPYLNYDNFKGDYDAGAFTDDPTAIYDGSLLNFGLHSSYSFDRSETRLLLSRNISNRKFSTDFDTYKYKGQFDHMEAVHRYTFNSTWQWLSGIAAQHLEMPDDEVPSTWQLSPYSSLFYHSGFGLSMEAGVRYVHHSTFGSHLTYSLNPSFLTGPFKFFVNISSGFKSPALTQLYGQFGPNPDLKPETSQSFEGGLQYVQPAGLFNIRLLAFHRSIDDMIIYTSRYENVDRQNVRGIEIEPRWKPNDILEITGYYGFMRGKVTTPLADSDSTYQDLIRKPKHSFGLKIGVKPSTKLFCSVNFSYYGQRDDLYFNNMTFVNSRAHLDPYLLVDLYTSYDFKQDSFRIFAGLNNLFNESYYEVYGYNVQDRTIRAGLYIKL